MSSRVVGHNEQRRRLASAWKAGRLAHAYLFVGPKGIGKRRFAVEFAQTLLCRRPNVDGLEPCGECESCRVFAGGNHPDYFEVAMEADRHEFRMEVMEEELLPKLALKPALGARRIGVVDDADMFNDSAANAFLKSLEEPPPGSALLLIAGGVEGLLPTIRSRCQTVSFGPLSAEETAEVLRRDGVEEQEAVFVAAEARGSVAVANELRDEAWRTFRATIRERLATPSPDLVRFAKEINKACEEVGDQARLKRGRAAQIIRTGLELFQAAIAAKIGGGPPPDSAVASAATLSEEALLDAVDRTIEADAQNARYLHLPTLIDCWIDDLAQIAAGAYAPFER